MASGRPPIVDRLREATGDLHREVESEADLVGAGRARYVWFVEKQLGFLEPLERRLAAASGIDRTGLDLGRRQRAHLFAGDLLHLGAHPARAPRCRSLPRVDSAARALGALYVLEGSTFGGMFLLHHLGPSLGLSAASGASGIAPYGTAVREMWVAYTDALDRFVRERPQDEAELIEGARDTFERMLAWLREPAPALEAARPSA